MKKYWWIFLSIFVAVCLGFRVWDFWSDVPVVTAPPVTEKAAVAEKSEPVVPTSKEVNFLFAGDMMFDRYVNHIYKNVGFDQVFANLDKSIFTEKDICFANLEGPVSDQPIVDDYPERSLVFDMPPETVPTIKRLGINGVSLANNHSLNAGASGFATTQSILAQNNIKYGGSQNSFDAESVIKFDSQIPVSIIAVDYLSFNDLNTIDAAIEKEKEAGRFVVVFPHWGEEYALVHNATQRQAAESFINAGADLIVGNHAHVVEDIEMIKNVPVFYALGNFVFDQTFSEDTQEGILLTGKIKDKSLQINILPFKSVNMKPQLMNDAEKKIMLDRINNGQDIINISLK